MSITTPYKLRPYQQEAVNAAISWFRQHDSPALIVLPTGAGKSLVIAELSRLAKGRVLVLAHVKELVAQNYAKFCALGLQAENLQAEGLETESVQTEGLQTESLETGSAQTESLAAGSLSTGSLEAESLKTGSLSTGSLAAKNLETGSLEAESLETENLAAKSLVAESLKPENLTAERLEAANLEAANLKAESLKAEDRQADSAHSMRPADSAQPADSTQPANHAQSAASVPKASLQADIFAAGLHRKDSQRKVVFGSVQSVARNLSQFNGVFSLLIVDECHRIGEDGDSQYQQILQHLRKANPRLCLLGLTATPYRLGQGWIYHYHYHGMVRGDERALFSDCIYELPLRYMVKHGYLVPPKRLDMPVLQYDFSQLRPQANGMFSQTDLDRAISRQRRVTPLIVRQIQHYAASRRATMIFAATVRHAAEVASLLPAQETALITGQTTAAQRDQAIRDFQGRRLRFLVNVAVLTTGFDAPLVDLIAILRPTESVSLYQQIIGRGLRLAEGKADCLILDYAGNTYDLYAPEVGGARPQSDCVPVQVFCPSCGFANTFWGRLNADGSLIEHFGRRCQGIIGETRRQQCDYRFRFKLCPRCQAENDIAARCCQQCDALLLDADDMLKAALQLKNTLVLRCSGMRLEAGADARGEFVHVTYYDEDGESVGERFRLHTPAQRQAFVQRFLASHSRTPGVPWPWRRAQEIAQHQHLLRPPDFVVASRQGQRLRIREKIFDYQGRYRLANQLR